MASNNRFFLLMTLLFSTQLKGEQVIIDLDSCYNSICALASLGGGTFAAGTANRTIKIFGVNAEGKYACRTELFGHTAPVTVITQLNNTTFASAQGDETIRIWEKVENEDYFCKTILSVPAESSDEFIDGEILAIASLDHDGNRFVSRSQWYNCLTCKYNGNSVKIWKKDINKGYTCTETINSSIDSRYKIASLTALNGGGFAVGGQASDITLYQTGEENNEICTNECLPYGAVVQSLIQLDNNDLIAGCNDGIRVFTQEKNETYQHDQQGSFVARLSGRRFASTVRCYNPNCDEHTYDNYHIKIWEKNAQNYYTCNNILKGHTHIVTAMTQLGNGLIVSGSCNGTIIIWHESDLQPA